VKGFQAVAGLIKDGIAGPVTEAAIKLRLRSTSSGEHKKVISMKKLILSTLFTFYGTDGLCIVFNPARK
jgi:murein L,D-transpeptidase YcbB/YkuD